MGLQVSRKENNDVTKETQILKQKHKDETENLSKRLKNAEEEIKSMNSFKEKYETIMQEHEQSKILIEKLQTDLHRKDNIIDLLAQSAKSLHSRNEKSVSDVIELQSDEDENTIKID